MPPHVPRKRLRSESPGNGEDNAAKRGIGRTKLTSTPRKATLFDDLDAQATSRRNESSQLERFQESEDESSSLSSLSDVNFEDVPGASRRAAEESEDDDDENIQFEDVPAHVAPQPTGDLELTLHRDTRIDLTNPFGTKKGPTKRERQIRIATHQVHVLCLLWHNAVRNSWLCDKEVQATLLSHIPPSLFEEIDRWRRNSGLGHLAEEALEKKSKPNKASKGTGRKTAERPPRDWGSAAVKLEPGAVDMSHGDPLFRLMKVLVAWWRKRFQITAPGIRKWGYMSLARLDVLTGSFRKGAHDPRKLGERIRNLAEFRVLAQELRGSRDVGAQLFTALLRSIGLDARLVANLQPIGFGWTKAEEADPEKEDPSTVIDPSAAAGPSNERSSRKSTSRLNGKRTISDSESSGFDDEPHNSDDDSIAEIPATTSKPQVKNVFDKDLTFPHYWTEVLSPVTLKYLPVDPMTKGCICTNRELVESLEPRGSKTDKAKQVMAYTVAYSSDGTAKDVTVRYLKRQMLPGKTKGVRIPVEKVPVYDRHGKVKRYENFDWFKTAMHGYRRGGKKCPITEIDELEDSTDLKPAVIVKKEVKEGEETLQYYKTHPDYVLERHLKREEALLPLAAPVRVFRTKGKGGEVIEENVYLRSDVVQVKSAETWHKQGRAPLPGEEPLKLVPYRAATLNRRREIAEAEAVSGQKVLQGLYSFDQTDWIIPEPIKDGIIPKNEYGNIDLFVEHMCPKGAVHVPYRGAMRVCKRLKIDFAEAVVDFEFGHRMAVPVIQGVVIAEENLERVMEELRKDEAERARKEDEKRRKAALGMWRKFLMGMRIVARIRQEYGEIGDSAEVFGHGNQAGNPEPADMGATDEAAAGGFFPDGYEEDEDERAHQTSGFFPVAEDEDESREGDADGGLVVDYGGDAQPTTAEEKVEDEDAPGKTTLTRRRQSRGKKVGNRRRRRGALTYEESEDGTQEEDDGSDRGYR